MRHVVEDTWELFMLKALRSPVGALLLLLWPWGGKQKGNKSMSIGFRCGKGCRWLRLALQGGTWDLGRFLKYYLCLSDKMLVRAECTLKQNLLIRVPAESGKVLRYLK